MSRVEVEHQWGDFDGQVQLSPAGAFVPITQPSRKVCARFA